jgi:uncharacterized protein DUF3168
VADGYVTAVMAGLRAALIADAGVAALVGDRVVDEPRADITLPYVRFGLITPVADDTDGTLGAAVTVGLEAHSRPTAGRVEAARICEAMQVALHRQIGAVSVAGYTVVEIEVQTWSIARQPDGASYLGTLSLEMRLDA